MENCGRPWTSDPNRLCNAEAIPGLTACLAHADPKSRQEFLATVHKAPASMTGLLRNLEIHGELCRELKGILTRFTPINFSGSEFIGACSLNVHFAGDVDFSHCRFRARAWFDGAFFPGKTYFTYSKFDEDASFNGARFDAEVRFDLATFSSYVRFGSDFRSDVWFDRATFESWVSVSLRNGIRVRFDDAILSRVVLGSFVGAGQPGEDAVTRRHPNVPEGMSLANVGFGRTPQSVVRPPIARH